MTSFVIAVCWLVTAAAVIDIVRRPASQWAATDRSRSTWVIVVVLFNVIGVAIYALFMLPRLMSQGGAVDPQFRKEHP